MSINLWKSAPRRAAWAGVGLMVLGTAFAATPMGADQGANNGGSIPAWNGGLAKPQAGYQPGRHHPDPFAAEKPILQITAANAGKYQDKLSAGLQAMLVRYKDYRVDVYPSHRTAAFPQWVYDATAKNAGSCKLVGESAGVQGCTGGGIPFRAPRNGAEAIWNHKLKYRGLSSQIFDNQAPVTAGGTYNLVRIREDVLVPYDKQGSSSDTINNVSSYFKQEVLGPARLAGQVILVHDSINDAVSPRQAWVYNPGQRRVRRAPNIAYDNPATASDGLRTNDMYDMFNGAMDRFDWKLVGKKEMYVPYNAYRAKLSKLDELVRPGHFNPDKLRYELHRVWVVEATLKPGMRHINPRRTFYLDEDSWQILQVDHYDGAGKIWRYSEALPIQYYEVPLFWTGTDVHYDLKSGRYNAVFLDNEDRPRDFTNQTSPAAYSPQNLRASGVR